MSYDLPMKISLVSPLAPKLIFAVFLPLLLLAVTAPSYGQNNRSWNRFNGWEITAFNLDGLPDNFPGGLARGLVLSGQWKMFKGTVRPPFSASQLSDDLVRIRLFMAREGYPVAKVDPVLTPSADGRQLSVILKISPGDPVRVAGLTLKGWPEGMAFPDTNNADILHKNNIFKDEKVDSSVHGLENLLLNSGYANSLVSCSLEIVSPFLVQLVFTVDPGKYFTLDEILISGCSDDLKTLAHRIINIDPGTEYSRARLTEASMDLRTTQLFSQVVLETEPLSRESLSLTAQLEDARMRRWSAAIGSWSDNPWMVRAGWVHRNLFKKGRAFDVHGTVAAHEQIIGTGVTWLGFLSPRARTRASFEYVREDEDAYLSNEYRTELMQSFRPKDRDIWNVGITLSHVEVQEWGVDEDMPENQGILLEFWTDRKWDWTDSPLYPTGGGYLKTSVTYAPSYLFSESPYAAIQLDGSAYKKIVGKTILAGRLRVGLAEPLGDSIDIISSRRFHAGGYNTHRGYSRRDLGPRDDEGNPRGGQAILLAGLEIRVPLIWLFDLAGFVDTGQLWQLRKEASLGGMAVALGVDLDIRTPLGPLRFGYAWNQTTTEYGQSSGLWHGGIGYPW